MVKEINFEELKKIQIGVLDSVDEFCRKNKLKYFLAYGTLLGAVRHKGYIPWDDDIDIVMPRPDYERFFRLFNTQGGDIVVKEFQSYAKVCDNRTSLIEEVEEDFDIGVNIDVFPLDGLPDDEHDREKFLKKIMFLNKMYALKIVSRKNWIWYKYIILILIKTLLKFVSCESIIRKIKKEEKRYKYENSRKVAICIAPYGLRDCLDKKIFEEISRLDFEGKKYNAPLNYDEYLKCIYGDYMQLPPKEKQVTHHAFKAFWK